MTPPLVTVIMPVFNATSYVQQAIQSILYQDYVHFELFIFDDGSTDNSLEIIKTFDDSRIQIFADGLNKGQPIRYNKGIEQAKGKYIAIMHADDIALPNRLTETVHFLEQKEDYGMVGSRVELIDNQGNNLHKRYGIAGDYNFLFLHRLFACPLMHTTILVRKSLLLQYPYDPKFDSCEDYDLFSRCSIKHKMHNLSTPLVQYRLHENNLTKTKRDSHAQRIKTIMQNLYRTINLEYTEQDFQAHLLTFYFHKSSLSIIEIKQVEKWLIKMKKRLIQLDRFDPNLVQKVLSINWYATCKKGRGVGLKSLTVFSKSPINQEINIKFRERLTIAMIALQQHDKINGFYTMLRNILSKL